MFKNKKNGKYGNQNCFETVCSVLSQFQTNNLGKYYTQPNADC